MELSTDLISQFVKVTKDESTPVENSTVYGTVVVSDNKTYVRFDGSDLLTPVSQTSAVENGERVVVTIKNHEAVITGNLSSPSVRTARVDGIDSTITEMGTVIAEKVSTQDLEANYATIANLSAANAEINNLKTNKLDASEASITYATISKLEADEADISSLKTGKLDATAADIKFATIESLNATDAKFNDLSSTYATINQLESNYATITRLESSEANITSLQTNKLDTTTAAITYANIDFSNIGEAAVSKLFTDSGIIKDLIVSEGKITGELVGVTIKGDLIEGGTVVADKLVVKGENGLYYKLNTDGVTTEAQQTDYNSLNGSIITAKSITATKIAVDDLVAFDATIGGFNIGNYSLYSGTKTSVDNTTAGIYMDKFGQLAVGDDKNFLIYYIDNEGKGHLSVSASSIKFGSGQTVESVVQNAIDAAARAEQEAADAAAAAAEASQVVEAYNKGELNGEDAVLLMIDSTRGTVFKNNSISTTLKVTIYKGSDRITDSTTMKQIFGAGAYLQWSWQRLDDDSFGVISSSDSMLSFDGFMLTISADEVDTKVTFMCELKT